MATTEARALHFLECHNVATADNPGDTTQITPAIGAARPMDIVGSNYERRPVKWLGPARGRQHGSALPPQRPDTTGQKNHAAKGKQRQACPDN